jgi:hypothetical protein
MTGQLLTHGDDGGFITCGLCGADAAGPCARCRTPVCGDCCVLTEGSSTPWAICLRCDRRGGRNIGSGWWLLAYWALGPLLALALLLLALHWFGSP